ncbi:MAG TPA: response regulator [bacterium]|nr:response regulator [bacterium]
MMNNPSGSGPMFSRVLVIDGDHADLVTTSKMLTAIHQVEICAETTNFTLAVSQVNRCNPDFVFCAVGANLDAECATIAKIREQHPTMRIVCIGDRSDSQSILKCFRSGADEFLMKPLQEDELRQVFQRLQIRIPAPVVEEEKAAPSGKVLAVWGSRGGCGATTIACNLAFDLAYRGPTILADFHEHQGDLALFFDLKPNFSLQDIWGNGDRIDEARWRA